METETATTQRTLLFVCTANMYRSRVAEALFNHYAAQDRLDWRAESRALADVRSLKGMTSAARYYLEARELMKPEDEPRDPVMLTVDEFEKAPLVIGLCRCEHEPMFNTKFSALAKRRVEDKALRFWNIYDNRQDNGLFHVLGNWASGTKTQPADSGVEHIDFAVRALVAELNW